MCCCWEMVENPGFLDGPALVRKPRSLREGEKRVRSECEREGDEQTDRQTDRGSQPKRVRDVCRMIRAYGHARTSMVRATAARKNFELIIPTVSSRERDAFIW